MTRRFGWKPETVPPRARFDALHLGSLVPPDMASLAPFVIEVLDQQWTGSCVAQSVCNALRIRLRAMDPAGPTPELPSRHWVYRLARETHGDANEDGGTYISSACYVLRRLGWPAESHCPFDPNAINRPVTVTERMHAFDQHEGVDEYGIDSFASTTEMQLRQAISMGYPVVFGCVVPVPFLNVTDWDPVDLDGPAAGGHAMIAIGYDDESVHVLNSWGTTWGNHGACRVKRQSFLDHARDLRAIEAVRRTTT